MRYESVAELENIGRVGAILKYVDGLPVARYLSSFWLFVEPEDQAFTPHWPTGYWESWVSAWMSREFENHEIFIDVGANVGYFTFQAHAAHMPTIAFEPNPKLCELLEKSADLNWADGTVIMPVALADKVGELTLIVPGGHSGGAWITASPDEAPSYEERYTVKTMPLDALADVSLQFVKKILVKIDAEGAEPYIWAGMQKLWAEKDMTVVLEWHSLRWPRWQAQAFAEDLAQYNVSIIDHDGNEQSVTADWLVDSPELHMVVVRK